MPTLIKICGIRRSQDVDYINEFLPDYIGFIFWEKSFRYVTLKQALELRRQTNPRIPAVGVFVNEVPEKIAECVQSGAIQIVQLHGQETEEDIAKARALLPGVPVWKAFKVRSIEDLMRAQASTADRILLDNGYGTGQCFDHSLLAKFEGEGFHEKEQPGDQPDASDPEGQRFTRPYILAGGLTPQNIPDVIMKYHPSMVDISSGVETDKCKDRDKIRAAVHAVRKM
ncbi:MAG: phosphoribosylanthranilate isomerase [Lachnospiraceae bacterium]|nr:phosphoribosylanthranilate isomerase [Lachnospiraceae bacterium]